MFVAASTECFPDDPLPEVLDRLAHLEYSCVELGVREHGKHLKPSQVLANFQSAFSLCKDTHRLDICSLLVEIDAQGELAYQQFQSICKLAKALKVVTLTIPSAEQGTPFNEEVEHFRKLVGIGSVEGVRVAVKTEVGRISQDPDTVLLMCNHVKGLGITLDPSHFIYNARPGADYEQLLKFVYHVQLRDTTKDKLQVRVGQGHIEYGKLITQLRSVGYDRALCVDIRPMDDVDQMAELRKMRLLLESLLL